MLRPTDPEYVIGTYAVALLVVFIIAGLIAGVVIAWRLWPLLRGLLP